MRITDELREFIETHLYLGATALGGWKEAAFAIADRIDEEHQKAIRELNNLADASVLLPVDADGVPIHIGDSVEIIGGEYGAAVAIELCEDGGWNVSMRPTGWDTPTLFAAECVRHHHTPTVEDILREFALRAIRESEGNYGDLDETCAEYAKRLRLVGEDE